MSYLFKLTRRLAHSRPLVVLAAAAAACTAGDRSITGPQSGESLRISKYSIASVAVSPPSASGTVGQSAQFTATAYNSSGGIISGVTASWKSADTTIVTIDATGYATAVAAGQTTIAATINGVKGQATATVTAPATVTNPGAVTDLAVSSIADTTATLSFTQVTDGAGAPAAYEVRYAVAPISWGSATTVTRGTCATPIAGTAIGAKLSCTVNGLVASTAYNFQIVAFRGTLDVNAVFGALSNPLAASTTAPVQPGVASVTVSPGSASGSVGQSAQFSATVKDANGNTLSGQTVVWSSTNNAVVTVSTSGYATAVGGGSAALVATAGGKSGQAAITVTGSTSSGTVSSVAVSPSSASIAAGATQQLTVTLTDLVGNILSGLTTTWTSSNPAVATVGAGGLVTGISVGSATITATSGGVSGSSSISITSSSTAPPPSTGWSNAPSAYPLISDQPFDLLASLNWLTAWNDNGLMGISLDAGAPLSASNVLQFTYPAGFAGGSAPAMAYRDFSAATHLYAGMWWKASSNWQGHNSNVNKLAFVYLNGTGGDIALEMYGTPGGPYDMRAALELNGADTRFFLVPNVNNVPITVGSWHKVEWQIEYNTTTSPANGIVRWWVDGQLIGNYTDVLFPSIGIVEYQLSPTWGGIGDVKSHTDYFWFDHVFLKGY